MGSGQSVLRGYSPPGKYLDPSPFSSMKGIQHYGTAPTVPVFAVEQPERGTSRGGSSQPFVPAVSVENRHIRSIS